MQTLKTRHRQAHTTVRRNRPRLTPQGEEDGLAHLRILDLGEFSFAFTLHITFQIILTLSKPYISLPT